MNNIFGSSNWRQIVDTSVSPAYKQILYDDEWLICMRVGVMAPYGPPSNVSEPVFDYHFWYRANDGKWYNKHGDYPSEDTSNESVNPSTAAFDSGWRNGTTTDFYNSETIYYAIKMMQM